MEYTIKINEEQAHILATALEAYVRLGLGQIDMVILNVLHKEILEKENCDIDYIRMLTYPLKREIFGFDMNSSHGITSKNISDKYRVASDIERVIVHRLSWDKNPKGGMGVNYQDPMKWSEQPLPTIEKKD